MLKTVMWVKCHSFFRAREFNTLYSVYRLKNKRTQNTLYTFFFFYWKYDKCFCKILLHHLYPITTFTQILCKFFSAVYKHLLPSNFNKTNIFHLLRRKEPLYFVSKAVTQENIIPMTLNKTMQTSTNISHEWLKYLTISFLTHVHCK